MKLHKLMKFQKKMKLRKKNWNFEKIVKNQSLFCGSVPMCKNDVLVYLQYFLDISASAFFE